MGKTWWLENKKSKSSRSKKGIKRGLHSQNKIKWWELVRVCSKSLRFQLGCHYSHGGMYLLLPRVGDSRDSLLKRLPGKGLLKTLMPLLGASKQKGSKKPRVKGRGGHKPLGSACKTKRSRGPGVLWAEEPVETKIRESNNKTPVSWGLVTRK